MFFNSFPFPVSWVALARFSYCCQLCTWVIKPEFYAASNCSCYTLQEQCSNGTPGSWFGWICGCPAPEYCIFLCSIANNIMWIWGGEGGGLLLNLVKLTGNILCIIVKITCDMTFEIMIRFNFTREPCALLTSVRHTDNFDMCPCYCHVTFKVQTSAMLENSNNYISGTGGGPIDFLFDSMFGFSGWHIEWTLIQWVQTQHGGCLPNWKFQMTISLQRVVQSTLCLILGACSNSAASDHIACRLVCLCFLSRDTEVRRSRLSSHTGLIIHLFLKVKMMISYRIVVWVLRMTCWRVLWRRSWRRQIWRRWRWRLFASRYVAVTTYSLLR